MKAWVPPLEFRFKLSSGGWGSGYFYMEAPGDSDIKPRLRSNMSRICALGDFLRLSSNLSAQNGITVGQLLTPGWCCLAASWATWMAAQQERDECPEFPVRLILRLCLL